MILRTFGWSFAITAAALIGALVLGGPTAFVLVAVLSILEISLSFDNAVINATVLERMNAFWQKMFLTVGILIAVFGMRLVFPLLIVGITASLSPAEVVRKALQGGAVDQSGTYANLLHDAHPAIAAFGGMFLLMLFLSFIFEDREITWLQWLERPLAKIGRLDQLPVIVALAVLAFTAEFLARHREVHSGKTPDQVVIQVLVAGILGIFTYILVNGLGELFEQTGEAHGWVGHDEEHEVPDEHKRADGTSSVGRAAGKAAFFLFLYLEVLDASFSFDGVIGAFAITQDIFIIATGLGVGAMYIRSITVFLVRKGTLNDYVYLEHGAHWAIGALAAILLYSVRAEVPEIVTGLIGVGFIGAALISSIIRNRKIENGHRASDDEPAAVQS